MKITIAFIFIFCFGPIVNCSKFGKRYPSWVKELRTDAIEEMKKYIYGFIDNNIGDIIDDIKSGKISPADIPVVLSQYGIYVDTPGEEIASTIRTHFTDDSNALDKSAHEDYANAVSESVQNQIDSNKKHKKFGLRDEIENIVKKQVFDSEQLNNDAAVKKVADISEGMDIDGKEQQKELFDIVYNLMDEVQNNKYNSNDEEHKRDDSGIFRDKSGVDGHEHINYRHDDGSNVHKHKSTNTEKHGNGASENHGFSKNHNKKLDEIEHYFDDEHGHEKIEIDADRKDDIEAMAMELEADNVQKDDKDKDKTNEMKNTGKESKSKNMDDLKDIKKTTHDIPKNRRDDKTENKERENNATHDDKAVVGKLDERDDKKTFKKYLKEEDELTEGLGEKEKDEDDDDDDENVDNEEEEKEDEQKKTKHKKIEQEKQKNDGNKSDDSDKKTDEEKNNDQKKSEDSNDNDDKKEKNNDKKEQNNDNKEMSKKKNTKKGHGIIDKIKNAFHHRRRRNIGDKHNCQTEEGQVRPTLPAISYVGEDVLLPCDQCSHENEEREIKWKKKMKRITRFMKYDDNEDESKNRIILTPYLELRIRKVQPSDQATYICMTNKFVNSSYYLTVKKLGKIHRVDLSNNEKPYSVKMRKDDEGIEEPYVYTVWGQWSRCSACDIAGERRRIGFCFININHEDFYGSAPCNSEEANKYDKSHRKRLDEILVERCLIQCSDVKKAYSILGKSNLLEGEIGIVRKEKKAHPGETVKLECIGTTVDDPVGWRNGTRELNLNEIRKGNGRIQITLNHVLIIKKSNENDIGEYDCHVDGEIKTTYKLRVSELFDRKGLAASLIYLSSLFAIYFIIFVVLMILKHVHRLTVRKLNQNKEEIKKKPKRKKKEKSKEKTKT